MGSKTEWTWFEVKVPMDLAIRLQRTINDYYAEHGRPDDEDEDD